MYVLAHSMLVPPTVPETCWKIVLIYAFLLVDYLQTFASDIVAAVTPTVHRNKHCIMHLRYTDTKYTWKIWQIRKRGRNSIIEKAVV